MLYEPSYMQPYLGDIDATNDNIFSCIINSTGGVTVNSYTLTINDLDGNVVDTITNFLSTPLYSGQQLTVTVPSGSGMSNGVDYTWKIKMVQSNPDIWITYGTVKAVSSTTSMTIVASNLIKAGMYLCINNQTRIITAYNSSTGVVTTAAFNSAPSVGTGYVVYSNYIISSDSYFKARTTPTLVLSTVPSTVAVQQYSFSATYTQAENVGYKYFIWTLYDSTGTAIENSGKIYSGAINYSFSGFINGNTYGIKVTVENQDGIELSTDISYFNVVYTATDLDVTTAVESICSKGAMGFSWEQPNTNPYTINGKVAMCQDMPYAGSAVANVGGNSTLSYSTTPNIIPYESTTFINWGTGIYLTAKNPNTMFIPEEDFDKVYNINYESDFSGDIIKLEGAKIHLLDVNSAAPAQCTTGDLYYNTVSKLIFTCTSANTWSLSGYTPYNTILYYCESNENTYFWDGTDLNVTTYDNSSYTVSYANGKFTYDIVNIDTHLTGHVTVQEIVVAWLLQSQDVVTTGTKFEWDDTTSWDDTLYWTDGESGIDNVGQYWYKITLLPTGIQVVKNART